MVSCTPMQIHFHGKDFGPLVFGQDILRKTPNSDLKFQVQTDNCKNKDSFSENDFWETALQNITESKTKFGRIAILIERKNTEAKTFFQKADLSKYKYQPTNKRAEKKPKIIIIETQALQELANEGLSDTVEFRRILRKSVRKIKSQHIDTIFFPSAIFGEEKTKKIINHISGTQIQCYFPSDFILENKKIAQAITTSKKQNLEIKTTDDKDFTKTRTEKILKTKLKNSQITN